MSVVLVSLATTHSAAIADHVRALTAHRAATGQVGTVLAAGDIFTMGNTWMDKLVTLGQGATLVGAIYGIVRVIFSKGFTIAALAMGAVVGASALFVVYHMTDLKNAATTTYNTGGAGDGGLAPLRTGSTVIVPAQRSVTVTALSPVAHGAQCRLSTTSSGSTPADGGSL